MKNKIYFISDLHFGAENKAREEAKETLAVSFLNSLHDAKRLVILGDLFDYWFEYKMVMPKGYYRFFSALKNLSEKGTKIDYILGNHDFFHNDFFENEFGTTLYENAWETEFFGKKFYLAHGDGLIPNDTGYKILKKIIRNKFVRKFFYLLHPDLGIRLARKTSYESRKYTSTKDYGENNALFGFAQNKIDEGFDYVIFGHSHMMQGSKYKNGYYFNLGTWLEKPYYGLFDGKEFKILIWDENEEKK